MDHTQREFTKRKIIQNLIKCESVSGGKVSKIMTWLKNVSEPFFLMVDPFYGPFLAKLNKIAHLFDYVQCDIVVTD